MGAQGKKWTPAVEGEDVFFPCSVSGVPEPLITWRKMAGKK